MTAFYSITNGTTVDTDGYFEIPGNFTPMFTPGFEFVSVDSGSGSPQVSSAYTFTVLSSAYIGGQTQITPVTTGSPAPPSLTPAGEWVTLVGGGYSLNYSDPGSGAITVPVADFDTSTSLTYPGRAAFNHGESINTNFLHLLENFAHTTAPVNPTEGQFWFDKNEGVNGEPKVYRGGNWEIFGGGGSEFWRDPAIIKDDTATNLTQAEALINLGTVQSVPLVEGDRILFSSIGGSPIGANIYIIVGTPGGSPAATLIEDNNRFPSGQQHGDVVYIVSGNEGGEAFVYDDNDTWTGFGGGGGSLSIAYERQTAGGGQTTFTLTGMNYTPTSDGSRLQVFVNGIKQTPPPAPDNAYTETDAITVEFLVAPGAGKVVEFIALDSTTDVAASSRELRTDITIGGSPPAGLITLNTISYVTGTHSLRVYLNGQKVTDGVDYTETSPNSITWSGIPVTAGVDQFEFYAFQPVTAGTKLGDIDDVNPSVSHGSPFPSIGDVLTWNGTQWTSTSPTSGFGVDYDEVIIVGSPASPIVNTTNVSTQAMAGGKAFQQVFLNGILQREGAGGNYTVTGANQITFSIAVDGGDEVLVYEL